MKILCLYLHIFIVIKLNIITKLKQIKFVQNRRFEKYDLVSLQYCFITFFINVLRNILNEILNISDSLYNLFNSTDTIVKFLTIESAV